MNIRYKNFVLKLRYDSILKVEDISTLDFLQNNLKIDTSIKQNCTKHYNTIQKWDSNMYNIVNELYWGDFREFGYPTSDDLYTIIERK